MDPKMHNGLNTRDHLLTVSLWGGGQGGSMSFPHKVIQSPKLMETLMSSTCVFQSQLGHHLHFSQSEAACGQAWAPTAHALSTGKNRPMPAFNDKGAWAD